MADPVPTEIAAGTSSTATTTASFSAQTAGTLLTLYVASDDYRTTSGTGRPESTGWTLLQGQQGNLGGYVWYKLSTGSETSVQYTIGSASKSVYRVGAATNIDSGSTPFPTQPDNPAPTLTEVPEMQGLIHWTDDETKRLKRGLVDTSAKFFFKWDDNGDATFANAIADKWKAGSSVPVAGYIAVALDKYCNG